MDLTLTAALVLIGAGAIVAGAVGLMLPPGERLGVVLALVIGAGAGVAALAIGSRNTTSPSDAERAFLIASAIGFAAVLASCALLWRRSRSRGGTSPT